MEEHEGVTVNRDILPIFEVPREDPENPRSFQGTGFLIAPGLFVTCWHCIEAVLPDDGAYAVALKTPDYGYTTYVLRDISRDANGTDLATARVDLDPVLPLTLTDEPLPIGSDVLSYGYPYTDRELSQAGQLDFTLNDRYLQGYITRVFYFSHRQYGEVPSYELDMPTPEGLSGAPLIKRGSHHVVGVIYGTNEVATVEHRGRVDPKSGEHTLDTERIVSFGLAHHTPTLHALQGTATADTPLVEFLRNPKRSV